eukprot:gene4121-14225_t
MNLSIKLSSSGGKGCCAATLAHEDAEALSIAASLPLGLLGSSSLDDDVESYPHLFHVMSLSNVEVSAVPQAAVELGSQSRYTHSLESFNSSFDDFHVTCEDVRALYPDPSPVVEPKAAYAVSETPRRSPSRFAPQQAITDKNRPALGPGPMRLEPDAHTVKSIKRSFACPSPLLGQAVSNQANSARHDAEVEALKFFGYYYNEAFSHCPAWKSNSTLTTHDMSANGYVLNK